MNFDFSETQAMLIDSASRLVKDKSGVEYWRAHRDQANGCDRLVWAKFAELGWLALAVPEEAGGLGGSVEDVALLMVELGRGLISEPIVSTAVLGVHLINRLADSAQRATLLDAIMAGEQRFALAHDEAGDRYETHTGRATSARRDGENYVLSGDKLMTLDGPSADTFIVSATLEDVPPYSLFLVPANAPGVTVSAYPLVDGTRAADIGLAEVRIPADSLLGSGEAAMIALGDAIDRAGVALVAQAVGAMEQAVGITSAYARERKQFGQPIGKFQAVQHMAADMFVAAYQARSALYQLLAYQDEPALERARAMAIARLIIAESGKIVGHNGIQIHGGYGITDEYPISHYWRRLYALERLYGDAEEHLNRLAGMGSADVSG